MLNTTTHETLPLKTLLTFLSISLFYFFEFGQMSYFNALAPNFLAAGIYNQHQIGALSAAYYYGNVFGLLPAGFLLDHFPLRKIFLVAILGSVIGACLLAFSHHYPIAWSARFCCGFFGGTFSFIGGIRILFNLLPGRFTLFMGIFLAVGMLGGLVCQYPLLWVSNHSGAHSAILMVFFFSIIVLLFNLIFLHPIESQTENIVQNKFPIKRWQLIVEILKNYRNWGDCFLIVFLDSPFTILGTLWGIVTLTSIYHFSASVSAVIITLMFAGSIVGSPLFGTWSNRYQNKAGLVMIGTGLSFLLALTLIFLPHPSPMIIALIFFGIGFLTGSQTIVFTWLIENMRPELIGRNSAINSMLFMGAGGVFKQVCALLLIIPSLILGTAASVNLLLLISVMMLLSTVYVCFRRKLFTSVNKGL